MATSHSRKILVLVSLAMILVSALLILKSTIKFERHLDTGAGAAAAQEDQGQLTPFGTAGPMGEGPLFSQEERLAMADEIGLSAEQQEAVQRIFAEAPVQDLNDGLDRMRQARELLTPEQNAKATQLLTQRLMQRIAERRQKAREALSDDDFRVFEQKARERLQAVARENSDLLRGE